MREEPLRICKEPCSDLKPLQREHRNQTNTRNQHYIITEDQKTLKTKKTLNKNNTCKNVEMKPNSGGEKKTWQVGPRLTSAIAVHDALLGSFQFRAL